MRPSRAALAYARAIKKTAIVVGDGYGFYTTRFFSAYILEGAQLVAEGHDPVLVEWARPAAGMVVPPLKVFDEVTLSLAVHGAEMARRYPRCARRGRGHAAGAARWSRRAAPARRRAPASTTTRASRAGCGPGCAALAAEVGERPSEPAEVIGTVDRLRDRLMLVQVLEAARCLEAGVLRTRATPRSARSWAWVSPRRPAARWPGSTARAPPSVVTLPRRRSSRSTDERYDRAGAAAADGRARTRRSSSGSEVA
jgi:3-hydroxyacyl-CoA dehydrogenase